MEIKWSQPQQVHSQKHEDKKWQSVAIITADNGKKYKITIRHRLGEDMSKKIQPVVANIVQGLNLQEVKGKKYKASVKTEESSKKPRESEVEKRKGKKRAWSPSTSKEMQTLFHEIWLIKHPPKKKEEKKNPIVSLSVEQVSQAEPLTGIAVVRRKPK